MKSVNYEIAGISCLFALGVNISNYLVLGATSPLTYQVLGHLKTVLIIVLGFIVFKVKKNFLTKIYLLVIILSYFLLSWNICVLMIQFIVQFLKWFYVFTTVFYFYFHFRKLRTRGIYPVSLSPCWGKYAYVHAWISVLLRVLPTYVCECMSVFYSQFFICLFSKISVEIIFKHTHAHDPITIIN